MNFLFFLLITFSASPVRDSFVRDFLVIWNVGQGQWLTRVSAEECRHYDMGGEFFPWKRLHQICADKKNKVYLSHWDWDHLGALSKTSAIQKLSKLCLTLPPQGRSSRYKESLIRKTPRCTDPASEHLWTPRLSKDSNAQSHILGVEGVLLPGDSPTAQEALWKNEAWVQNSRVLILGHHGSRTSTSQALLQNLPLLRLTIASARWNRYRHPHPLVVARLKAQRIPLLRTEDWGNIWLEQAPLRTKP